MQIDGKRLAEEWQLEIKEKLNNINKKCHLVVITVGNDKASEVYVRNKQKACEKCGIEFENIVMRENVSTDDIVNIIECCNVDERVHGIIVQLPVPEHIDVNRIIRWIDKLKDVDGFRKDSRFDPCTPKGIIRMLEKNNIDINGKHIVIFGRSNIVGKPLARMLLERNAAVTVLHSKVDHKKSVAICKTADIIISATGNKDTITLNHISTCKTIIDVGIFRDENNKLRGDIDPEFYGLLDMCKVNYTPVPGGVGPMTVAALMDNVVKAMELQKG